jgi:glycosyltransferase involved in cell wall biosynthesis
MSDLSVSVVIVSRDRPEALKRALVGVSQIQFDTFEVVVVADPPGIAAAGSLPFADMLKLVPFDEANISAARNIGLTHAAGDVVAFIDDDAVPEPQWLRLLVAPAARPEVAAMGGFVRGRNGISFQWKAASLDEAGAAHPLEVDPDRATILTPPMGRAIKTEGTNMAFRRDVLIELGGFDSAFHYFLDETDMNMRLAAAGHATAIVPRAEVHHGYAENRLRHANRVPRDLFDIGASWGVFQRKHVREKIRRRHWHDLRSAQRVRLLDHVVRGGLEPRDVRRLMARLDSGYEEGRARPLGTKPLPRHPAAPFQAFNAPHRPSVLIASRPIHHRRDRRDAAERAAKGDIVTLLILSPTALFHRVWFDLDGYWVQRGGILGKSDRTGPLLRMTSRARRINKEVERLAIQRGFTLHRLTD